MATIQTTTRSVAPTRVLCVDDSPDMTEVMRMLIDAEPMMKCVGCLDSADELARRIRRLVPRPHVVLLDASMPGSDPLETMTRVNEEFPAVRTIVLSGRDDPAFVLRVRAAGAWGYVSKACEPDVILRAVRSVADGQPWWP